MGRYTGPRCRLCRREGEKLFLKGERCFTDKCAFERRKYPPGFHGPTAKRKLSIYGLQLREKQKAKRIYGISEGQFRRYFEIARKMPGNTGENLLSLLERRLDNVVYHLGFAISRPAARQLVTHGHILVNGKKVNIPSYLVCEGDVITLKEKMRNNLFVRQSYDKKDPPRVPKWLSLNKENFEGKVLRLPKKEDVSHPIKESLIVEFYSKV
jgi:small subunit ribosomal protein S4